MNWYLSVIKNYTGFSGRARRKEYWMFVLINMIICAVLNVIQAVIGMETPYISIIYSLGILLPSIAVAIRRLHDTERSGWWLLLSLIPIIGTIVIIVFLCQNGTAGANRFGADPKQNEIN
ncbi:MULTISPECIES: DUF805 domain-containing protein [Citrobacter]|uniref:Inner membrane protein YhaI n=1 Tax=Citrobacter amalonaticus TaxID=35703 RepID=A0A6N2XAP7_CITAM|nr:MULTISPECIES: DUF805 domain-containing protein [Citrobacter]EKY5004531.1 DUF805 domain-containing protein [Citrobacter amalonaticus]ELN9499665.1 DUF805 domain-containing protein [Citrobacter amalonaticus]ELW9346918.1 DUF805 domain-containing protein [Citrobacter amalonaticus]KDF12288.1 hypothetical protein AF41_00541 [Citrobacter sp. MGH 55]MBE0397479.1 DUF805 domain-containing protein [Citrobacter amalonaticus]